MPKRWIALTALLVAGCEDVVPMATTTSDAAGKTFAAPAPGMSTIYIYRPDGAGSVLDLTANQRTLGALAKKTYLRIDVAPGSWDIRCRSSVTTSSTNSLIAVAQPNTTMFVEARYSLPAAAYCRLQEVDAAHARQEISALTRIQEVGGASN